MPGGIFYLPEGYTAGAELAEDGYPRTLTRKDDGTIFIRIVGGDFTMGGVEAAAGGLPGDRRRPTSLVRRTAGGSPAGR